MFAWTDEDIRTAGKMWTSGATAQGIANHLGGGLTRNAVIGKMRRAGYERSQSIGLENSRLANRKKNPIQNLKMKGVNPAKAAEIIEKAKPKMPAVIETVPVGGLRLEDLERNQCRWPINNPAQSDNFRFCGAHVDVGRNYCCAHRAVAFTARQPSKKPPTPVIQRSSRDLWRIFA